MSSARIRRKTGRLKLRDLPLHDQAEIRRCIRFCDEVGQPGSPGYQERLRRWVEKGDPIENCRWLGLSPGQARHLGLLPEKSEEPA